jgi:hypothetical protein
MPHFVLFLGYYAYHMVNPSYGMKLQELIRLRIVLDTT